MSTKQVFNLLTTKSDWSLNSLYHITPESNIGADHGLKQLLIVEQILHVGVIGNVKRTVWRICIPMLGCRGLKLNDSLFYTWKSLILLYFFPKDLTPMLRATPTSGASLLSERSSILASKEKTVSKDSNDNEEPTQGDELRRLKTSRSLRHPRSATTGALK